MGIMIGGRWDLFFFLCENCMNMWRQFFKFNISVREKKITVDFFLNLFEAVLK